MSTSSLSHKRKREDALILKIKEKFEAITKHILSDIEKDVREQENLQVQCIINGETRIKEQLKHLNAQTAEIKTKEIEIDQQMAIIDKYRLQTAINAKEIRDLEVKLMEQRDNIKKLRKLRNF